jgi:Cold shock proteins
MSTTERITGTVKWFSNEKGYGFITPDPTAVSNSTVAIPEDIFVHQSTIHSEGFRTLGEGWQVEFLIGQDEQGKVRAEDVTAVGGGFCSGPRKPRRRFRRGNADNRTNNDHDDETIPQKSAGAAKKRGKPAVMWHQHLKDPVKELLDEKGISRKNGTLNIAFGDARMKLGINSYASLVHKDKIIAEGVFSCDEEGEGLIALDWKRAIEFDHDSQSWKVREQDEIGKLISELNLSSDDIQAVQRGENMASIMGEELPDPKSALEGAGFQMRRVVFFARK